MSIRNRIERLEDLKGINKINVAEELERLKALELSSNASPKKTKEDYEALIAECKDDRLIHLYQKVIDGMT